MNKQINATIAKLCGYKHLGSPGFADPNWKSWADPDGVKIDSLPNFCDDLNAMHMAEKILLNDDTCLWHKYSRALFGMVGEVGVHIDAQRRAEVLLTILGLMPNDEL